MLEQTVKEARELAEARVAQGEGTATEDQILLINRRRIQEEAEEAKKNRPGIFKRTTNWMFSGLSSEEKKGGRSEARTLEFPFQQFRQVARVFPP